MMALVMRCVAPGCGYVAIDRDDYFSHCRSVHRKVACSMDGCMLMFGRKRVADIHFKVQHKGIRFGCSLCPDVSRSDPSGVYEHLRSFECDGKVVELRPVVDVAQSTAVSHVAASLVASSGDPSVVNAVASSSGAVVLSNVLLVPAGGVIDPPADIGSSAVAQVVDAALASVRNSSSSVVPISPLAVTPGRSVDANVRVSDGTVVGAWVDDGDGVATMRVADVFMDELLAVTSEEEGGDDDEVEGADEDDGDVGGEEAEDEGNILRMVA